MEYFVVFMCVGFLVTIDAQYLRRGNRRPPGTMGTCPDPNTIRCRTSCTPGDRPCERGRMCCLNACGGYECVRPVRPGGGVPHWCPPGSPRVRCFVNPCNVDTCPRYPRARCINDNPCEPSCSGNFYLYSRKLSRSRCTRRRG